MPARGFFVVDLDGDEANARFEALPDAIPKDGYHTITPSGGRHFYFREPSEEHTPLRKMNGTSAMFGDRWEQENGRLSNCVDILPAGRAQVLAPGCRVDAEPEKGKTGGHYTASESLDIPEWPIEYWGKLLTPSTKKRARPKSKGEPKSRHDRLLHWGIAWWRKHSEDGREALMKHLSGRNAEFDEPKDDAEVIRVAEWIEGNVSKTASTVFDAEYLAAAFRRVGNYLPVRLSGNGDLAAFRATDGDLDDPECEGDWIPLASDRLYSHMRAIASAEREIVGSKKAIGPQLLDGAIRAVVSENTKNALGAEETLIRWNPTKRLIAFSDGQVFDTETGKYRRAVKGDMMFHRLDVAPDADMNTDTWDRFLREITCGDEALAEYLLDLAASCLLGHQREKLHILLGGGRNGKGVFVRTLFNIMGVGAGGLARKIGNEWIRKDSHVSWQMGLHRRGLAVIDEAADERVQWPLPTLKEITGGGPLTARQIRGKEQTFEQTHNLLMLSNKLPAVPPEPALMDRVVVIPFDFHADEPDPLLPEKLKAECPGILADLCVRARRLVETGDLDPVLGRLPEAVQRATSGAWASLSRVAKFISVACVLDSRSWESNADLWKAYGDWEESEGTPEKYRKRKGKFLEELRFLTGSEECRREHRRGYRGLRLATAGERQEREEAAIPVDDGYTQPEQVDREPDYDPGF